MPETAITLDEETTEPDDSIVVAHVKISDEDREKYVSKLCAKIQKLIDSPARKELEEQASLSVKQFRARLKRQDIPEDSLSSNLDFTTTREICEQAISRHINPIMGYDAIFVAEETDSDYRKWIPEYQKAIQAKTDRPEWLALGNNTLEQAAIFPSTWVKITWEKKTRKISYRVVTKKETEQTEDYEGNVIPISDEVLETVEKEIVDFDGPKTKVIRWADIYHKIPLDPDDLDDSWIAQRFNSTRTAVLEDVEEDSEMYRKDLKEVFGKKLEGLSVPAKKWADSAKWSTRNQTEDNELDPEEDLVLFEVYDRYKGRDVLVTIDLESGKDLRFVYNWHEDEPNPFACYSWYETLGSVDSTSLCDVMRPMHRGYSGSMNQRFDQASRSLEVLLIALEDLGLGEFYKNGHLETGLAEIDATAEELDKGTKEISLTTAFTQHPELENILKEHMRNVAGIADAFFGNEVAGRPTARGTMSVIEEAKQPLFNRLERYRAFLEKIQMKRFARMRQYFPRGFDTYLDSLNPEDEKKVRSFFNWPEGYWKEQIRIRTKVSSQNMSKSLRRQEALAIIERLSELFQPIAELSGQMVSGDPTAIIASQLFAIYITNLRALFEEFEIEGIENLEQMEEAVDVAQVIQQAFEELQGQLQAAENKIAQLLPPEPPPMVPGGPIQPGGPEMGPGPPGPPQAGPGMGAPPPPAPGQIGP